MKLLVPLQIASIDMIVFAWSEVAIDERIGIPPQTDASNAIVRPSLRASSKSSGP